RLTMAPRPPCASATRQARPISQVPRTLTSITRSQVSICSAWASLPPELVVAALLTSPSSPPSRRTDSAAPCSMEAGSHRPSACTSKPCPRSAAASAWARSASTSAMTTRPPATAMDRAKARPSPRAAPVTSTRRPLSRSCGRSASSACRLWGSAMPWISLIVRLLPLSRALPRSVGRDVELLHHAGEALEIGDGGLRQRLRRATHRQHAEHLHLRRHLGLAHDLVDLRVQPGHHLGRHALGAVQAVPGR